MRISYCNSDVCSSDLRLEPNLYYAHGFSGQGVALTGLDGSLMAEAIAGQAERFDVFARIPHRSFPGGVLLRRPAQILGMLYYSLRDKLKRARTRARSGRRMILFRGRKDKRAGEIHGQIGRANV